MEHKYLWLSIVMVKQLEAYLSGHRKEILSSCKLELQIKT